MITFLRNLRSGHSHFANPAGIVHYIFSREGFGDAFMQDNHGDTIMDYNLLVSAGISIEPQERFVERELFFLIFPLQMFDLSHFFQFFFFLRIAISAIFCFILVYD